MDSGSLRYLHKQPDEEVAEQLNIEKLAPGGAQVEHELAEHLFVDLDAEELECIMAGDLDHLLDVLFTLLEHLDVDSLHLALYHLPDGRGSDLHAIGCRYHAFVGEALGHLLHPVIQS